MPWRIASKTSTVPLREDLSICIVGRGCCLVLCTGMRLTMGGPGISFLNHWHNSGNDS